MLLAVLIAASAFPLMRSRASAVEEADLDPVDKVHRLRVSLLAFTFGCLVLAALAGAEIAFEAQAFGTMVKVVGWVVLFGAIVAALVLAQLAVRPAYQRLRGIDPAAAKQGRTLSRQVRGLLIALPQLLWLAVFLTLLRMHVHPLVLLAAIVVFLLIVAVVTPALIRGALVTHDPDAHVRGLVEGVCERAGTRIRGVRILDTRANPVANAAFAGFGPGPKVVFLTDVLVDELTDEELEAVVAHEVGHRVRHHVGKKLGVALLSLLALAVVIGLLAAGSQVGLPRPVALVVALLAPVVALAGQVLLRGAYGIRLEKEADDFAVSLVGAEPLRHGLEKMAETNMMKRRTGRLWNVLTSHPGIEERVARLDARELEDSSAP